MPSDVQLPIGTITLLFTDIEGSTRLLNRFGHQYTELLSIHCRLLRSAFGDHDGTEISTQGDSFLVAFRGAFHAVAAALDAQRALSRHSWPEGGEVRVRMGLHTGEPSVTSEGYVGLDLHLAARICGAGHGGQVLLSEATSELVRRDLPAGAWLHNLGGHGLRDIARPENLYQLRHDDLPADFPPLRSRPSPNHNFPVQLTRFIGRQSETERVTTLLASARLITLTGLGGCGKTRLGLHVAADVLKSYADGAWFIDLASLTDASLVPQAVAAAMRVRERPDRSVLATLQGHLESRSLLLLLDNCEHVVDACATLSEALLSACPELTVLATSREALGVAGEVTYRVPALGLPDHESVDELSRSDSVTLFVDRARAVAPDFELTSENLPAVAQVCRRLDGLALAIELAAARVRVMTVHEINARLDDRFRLLSGRSATALPRQRTLRAAIDWSHDLLSPAEQSLLHRLAVFRGGWTLDSAEAVCAADPINRWQVLDLVTSLVDKSLVLTSFEVEGTRYRITETVRQYALDRLTDSGQADEYRGRHRDHFLAYARQHSMGELGPERAENAAVLEREIENLRTAFDHSLAEPGGSEKLVELTGYLLVWWDRTGRSHEGVERLSGAVAASAHLGSTPGRAWCMVGLGVLCINLGRYDEGLRWLEESLGVRRELGDMPAIINGLFNYGCCLNMVGYLDEAHTALMEALELADPGEQGAPGGSAGDPAASTSRPSGVLANLGVNLVLRGDHASAEPLLTEELALRDAPWDRSEIRCFLGRIEQHRGDFEAARAHYREALAAVREHGYRNGTFVVPYCFADLELAQGEYRRSAMLYGAHDAERERLGTPLFPVFDTEYRQAIASLRRRLGSDPFEAAYSAGRALTIDQAAAVCVEGGLDAVVDDKARDQV